MIEYTFQTRLPLPQTVEELHERIEKLTAVKDALDRELAILMGHKPEWKPGTPWHCLRCGHKWLSRLPHQPRQCAQCKSYKFDTPPKYTYEERIARRKSLKARLEREQKEFAQQEKELARLAPPLPHSVMTRVDVPMIIPPVDDIQSIALTPPPTAPMSLRERLAMMSKGGDAPRHPYPTTLQHQSTQDSISPSAAADGAHSNPNESVSEDDLIEAINGQEE